jgi:hypothetical protein
VRAAAFPQSVRATPGYSGGCAVAVWAANDVIVMAAATTITSFEARTATPLSLPSWTAVWENAQTISNKSTNITKCWPNIYMCA